MNNLKLDAGIPPSTFEVAQNDTAFISIKVNRKTLYNLIAQSLLRVKDLRCIDEQAKVFISNTLLQSLSNKL